MSALPPAARRLLPVFCATVDALEGANSAPITAEEQRLACSSPCRARAVDEKQANYMFLGFPYVNHRLAESRRAGDGKEWQWQLRRVGTVVGIAGTVGLCALGFMFLGREPYKRRTEGGVREDRILRRLIALNNEARNLTDQVSLFCAQDVGTLAHLARCQAHALGVLAGLRDEVVHDPDTRIAGSRQLRESLRGSDATLRALGQRVACHQAAYNLPAEALDALAPPSQGI